jgi:hypothetical protein
MKKALNNIFAESSPRTSYGTISRRLSGTKYELRDSAGRIRYAESTDYYPAGAEVVVQDGRIVSQGRAAGKPKIYEV